MISNLKLTIPKGEIDKLERIIRTQILEPTITEIDTDTKDNIRLLAMPYAGVSRDGITNPKSVSSTIRKGKNYKLRIEPTIDHFEINKEGYLTAVYKNVSEDPDLYDWVSVKYNGRNKDQILSGEQNLKVRAKDEQGKFAPLGDEKRDFFGRAFNLILTNRNKYGLR